MKLAERLKEFQIKNNLKTKQDLADYFRITRPSLNKILNGQLVSEFVAWKVFIATDGYVRFEELTEYVSDKYYRRLQRKGPKILVDKHLRILTNEGV